MTEISRKLLPGEQPSEAIRLNKYLSEAGICSRREADRRILEGRILVDGQIAVMGQKVFPGQQVLCDGSPVHPQERCILLAFHKPVGVECTTAPEVPGNVIDYLRYPSRIFPIGRLDKNSSGLLLLTNKGALSDQILRSSNYHEKEYLVTVDRKITESFLQDLQNGVSIELDDGARTVLTRPCKAQATGENSFRIILTQGYNRQIRRMCKALNYQVVDLKRVRILNILLGDLAVGTYRDVTKEEFSELLRILQGTDQS